MAEDHPFKPGTRVAVSEGRYTGGYREAFVDKVYKTGRFTLVGDPDRKQWTARLWGLCGPKTPTWEAWGSGYSGSLKIWDETTDAEITAANEERDRQRAGVSAAHAVALLPQRELSLKTIALLNAAVENHKAEQAAKENAS